MAVKDLTGKFPKVKPSLILKGFGLQALKTKLYDFGEEEADTQRGVSYLGTPVFMNVEFSPGAYVDRNNKTIEYGQLFTNTADDSGFKIDTVLCDVTITKQIITTNIQGVNGSVKEYISQNDYEITIRGALVDESGQRYPEEEVLQLVEYCEVPDSIKIYSRFLNDNFNIQYLTIQSVSLPQVEGTENVQLFEIKAISDNPIELTINEIN
tara:strand:- start:396 stop:1025 length:630 start_codon:yes stop_codon:yes gene_type:complete